MRTPTRSRWMSNENITRCYRRLGSVLVGDRMPAEWEPPPDRGLGPSVTHGWASLPECERSAAMVRRTWGQSVAVCPRLQLTSHTQPTLTLSRIKCERYIFYQEVYSFVHWSRHYVWLCICMCIYNTTTSVQIEPRSDSNKMLFSYSPNLQYSKCLTVRFFSVKSRTFVGGVLLHCKGAVGVFYSLSRLGHREAFIIFYSPSWLSSFHQNSGGASMQ